MDFLDRLLACADCGRDFIFTAGEQLFFFDKQFKYDPKRCKRCKSKRAGTGLKAGTGRAAAGLSRTETRTECSACGIETTVPFKPTQGRPVLCRQCFQSNREPTTEALVTAAATAEMVAGTGAEHTGVGAELLVAAQAPPA
jgi:CxxC-x17-CxxC domain-containing protein